jgi:methionine salvage enolase-phosphatase E1
MYYLKSHINDQKLIEVIELLILSDPGMRERSIQDIVDRVLKTFGNEQYLERVSASRQRWIDDEIHDIADGIIEYLSALMRFLL